MLSTSYQIQAQAEIERRRRLAINPIVAPDDWQDWLKVLFPRYVSSSFAKRHVELWSWIDGIVLPSRPLPFVAIWPRGGAKSTSAELGCVRIGAKKARRYVWYVSGTQDKADAHVESIAALLESESVERYYPDLARRAVGKYGNSKGWRRSRLRTANDFTVDALGLDTGSRGVKIEDARPDMIILDDVDELHDSLLITTKKIETITKSVLPSGANGNCAVLFIQNLIHPNSIASQLVDGRADFIADKILSGPYPAIDGFVFEQQNGHYVITGGDPTWDGQNIEICQSQISTWGFSAFCQEAQHEVDKNGGIWSEIDFQHIEYSALPEFVRTSVWVDPAVTTTDQSDSMGISVGGITTNHKLIGLYWWEGITTPEDAIERAIWKALEWKSLTIGVETDQGGDTWESVYYRACDKVKSELQKRWIEENPNKDIKEMKISLPAFVSDKAGAGYGSKVERNSRMLTDYENGNVLHMIGTHAAIEKSLRRFPNKPLDLADSWFWVWNDLVGNPGWSW